jgi:hypothetical protein
MFALNAAGYSAPSNTGSGIPFATPTPPTITAIDEGNARVVVYFTKGEPRGSEITECAYWLYSYDTETQTEIITETILDTTDSPFVITDLVNGFTYGIALKNKNANGYSDLSAKVYATPFAKPSPPIITNVVAANWSATIDFEHGEDGGRPLTNIFASFNDEGYRPIGIRTFQLQFTQLLNQNTYTLKLVAVNLAGISDPAEVSFTPYYDSTNVPFTKLRNTANQSLSRREQYALVARIDRGKTRYITNG